MQIEYAKKADRQELLDFLLTVFRRNNPTHPKFEDIYPDLFLEDDEVLGRHAIIREDGKIASCVGTYLVMMQAYGRRILTAGVGQVSTAANALGKGYMTALLKSELARCRREGAVLAWLGGRRDRYSHFGFDCCGIQLDYSMDAHSLGDIPRSRTVTHVEATAPDAITPAMFELRERTVNSALVPLDIFRIQMTRLFFKFEIWKAIPEGATEPDAWAVYDANSNRIQEWSGSHDGKMEILHQMVKERGKIACREPICETEFSPFFRNHSWYISPSSMQLAVLNKEKLVEAYGPLIPADFQIPPDGTDDCELARRFFGPGRNSAELPFTIPGIFHV